jgi:uncharacterized protein (DUF1330 family)
MSAYVIAEVEIHDPEAYKEYLRQTPQTIAQYGGRFLARGGRAELLDGAGRPNRVAIVEFESYEQAKAWYHSPGYQDVVGIRFRNSTSRLIVVEGVAPT